MYNQGLLAPLSVLLLHLYDANAYLSLWVVFGIQAWCYYLGRHLACTGELFKQNGTMVTMYKTTNVSC